MALITLYLLSDELKGMIGGMGIKHLIKVGNLFHNDKLKIIIAKTLTILANDGNYSCPS